MDSSFPASPQPHVLAIPFPAQGHLNPLMRVCKILASHGFLITFVNVDPIHHRISECARPVQQRPYSSLHAVDEAHLPRIRRAHVPARGLDMANDFRIPIEHLSDAVKSMDVGVEQLIEQLSREGPPVTCLISDILTSSMSQKVADKFSIRWFALLPSSLSFTLFWFYLCIGKIDPKDVKRASAKQDMPVDKLFHDGLPGLPSIRVADLPHFSHVENDNEVVFPRFMHEATIAFEKAYAIISNSFEELEGPAFKVLSKNLRPKIFPLGPLMQELADDVSTSLWKEEDACLDWLQNQPPQSVLYISLGSVALISKLQFEEILIGIEASNQRFLWAFRPDLVTGTACDTILDDFLVRTKDYGYVVQWAPQSRVLSHPSVGGFLTHCGWNSVTEAIGNGIPMLCWPYYGDQPIDAKYVVEEWKVGLRFEAGRGGLVSRVEVERKVKELMAGEEGKMARKNATKLRDASRNTLQEGGSSHHYTQAFVEDLRALS